jgi:hypothetical protein
MFREIPVTLSGFAAKKQLEGRYKPNPAASVDELLSTLRQLVATHEAADERFMMWLAEEAANFCLMRYVETEAELVHAVTLGYPDEEKAARAKLTRIEAEWRICATLHAYLSTVHIENSAAGIAEFLNRQHPKPGKVAKK